jgi:hypothetical protein
MSNLFAGILIRREDTDHELLSDDRTNTLVYEMAARKILKKTPLQSAGSRS